ncbi:amino acid ABC transporter permease [Cohnella faecalis]|uniref:Amino acid ABC transporter permease n=1 Tax=Cohnella faecalis TaxID=2315694 RepID=A0A398CFV9_9BACL|nr:amino acid ABC transporter permease [Cohnella faecalis]RIE01603.1 amino acid ABC transporter permease [Cohnella faecalis]
MWDLFVSSFPSLMDGMLMTLRITVVALLAASVIGFIIGLMNISHFKALRAAAIAYIDLIRGTPLIVQAFFIYFGLPSVLDFRITALTAGTIALSLNAGAYMAEIFRAGIQSVDKGQMEAARSLGLPYRRAMLKVIMPQAIQRMIPAILNQFVISLKDTSILSAIGIRELTQSGEIIIAGNYKSFEIWGMVGLMYFVVITMLSYVSRRIERYYRL